MKSFVHVSLEEFFVLSSIADSVKKKITLTVKNKNLYSFILFRVFSPLIPEKKIEILNEYLLGSFERSFIFPPPNKRTQLAVIGNDGIRHFTPIHYKIGMEMLWKRDIMW